MADSESTLQLTPPEMRALADRFRARAASVLFKDQPEQASDLRTAARHIEHLAELHTAIRTVAAAINDATACLIEHVGGA